VIPERTQVVLLAARVELVGLVAKSAQHAGVSQQLDHRPGLRAGARVVSREDDRDEDPGDLVRAQLLSAGVAAVDQALQPVVDRRARARPLLEDRGDALDQPRARGVASLEGRNRQVRVEVRDRVDCLLEVSVEELELRVDAGAHVVAHEAARRGVEEELLAEVQQIELALVAELREHLHRLFFDERRVRAHRHVAQRHHHEAHLLLEPRARRVEDHAPPEDRGHQLVRLAATELIVGRTEEGFVRFGPGDEHGRLTQQLDLDELTALAPRALQQLEGVLLELDHVPRERQGAREARHRRPARARVAATDVAPFATERQSRPHAPEQARDTHGHTA
jgi:hypothetical protein